MILIRQCYALTRFKIRPWPTYLNLLNFLLALAKTTSSSSPPFGLLFNFLGDLNLGNEEGDCFRVGRSAEVLAKLFAIDSGRHDNELDLLFVFLIQHFFEGDESEIHFEGSFMNFVQDDVRVFNIVFKEQLLDKDPISHVYNVSIFS